MIFIKNARIKPITSAEIENGTILIENGKIVALGADLEAPEAAQIIDAEGRLVTPGLVESHCHIGLHNESMRWEGADFNESSDPVTPQMRAIDSFNPMDGMLKNAIHGSAYAPKRPYRNRRSHHRKRKSCSPLPVRRRWYSARSRLLETSYIRRPRHIGRR